MKKINLVMSTYNDEHLFNYFRHMVDYENTEIFFYKKNDELKVGEKINRNGFIEIPNHGSCDYAFLMHIVDNYDNLSDYTIFTKLNWDFNNGHEVFRYCTHYDFFQLGHYEVSQIYYDSKRHQDPSKFKFTYDNVDVHDMQLIRERRGNDYDYAGNADNKSDWFKMLFGEPEHMTEVRTNAIGPCFSVSRELIRRHSKETYEYFLRMLEPFNSWSREKAKYFWHEQLANGEDTYSVEFQNYRLARYYHDELARFWTALFTFGMDRNKYSSNKPLERTHPNATLSQV